MPTTLTIVIRILAEQIGMEESEIIHDQSIKTQGADSLDYIEMIMALEDCYDIEIDEDEIMKFKTPAAIAAYLRERHSLDS